MTSDFVLALDQGTSSTKAVLLDTDGVVRNVTSAPLAITYPRPGWVEQDPEDVVASVAAAARACLADAGGRVVAVGLSTQRESALLWNTDTGEPIGPLLGWQDQRSAAICADVRAAGHADDVRRHSGLPLDPMFSAAKIRWLLDTYDRDRTQSRAGRITAGTVDAWLLRALAGTRQIEHGNASRTQLLDVRTGEWSPELLAAFDVPRTVLRTPPCSPTRRTSQAA
jgi:glycerol kinase